MTVQMGVGVLLVRVPQVGVAPVLVEAAVVTVGRIGMRIAVGVPVPVVVLFGIPMVIVVISVVVAMRVRMGLIGVSVAMHHVSMGVLMSRVAVAIAVGHVVVLVVMPDVVVADALLLLLVHPRPEAFLYPVAARAPRYLTCRWAEEIGRAACRERRE